MQLIFETEHTADIKTNMSTLEEPVGDKLITNALMDSLKHISNGNKENIQRQDNISRNEKNLLDSIKLDNEELNAPVDDILEEEILEEIITDEDEDNSNPEESVFNDQPDATESNDEIDDVEKIQLTEQDDCSQEDLSNSSTNKEENNELQLTEEVNDILAQKANALINNKKREQVPDLNSIGEDSQDDRMKAVRENLFKSIEIRQVLEEDSLTEDSSQENCAIVEKPVTLLANNFITIPDEPQEDQATDKFETSDKVVSSIMTEAEIEITNDDNQCLGSENDKQKVSCVETVTIQDELDDIIDTTVPEPMNVDNAAKEIDSDKEDNEIMLLDSPVSADIDKNEEENNTATDCDVAMDIGDKHSITEIDKDDATDMVHKDQVSTTVNIDEMSEAVDKDRNSEIVHRTGSSEIVQKDIVEKTVEVFEIIDKDTVSEVDGGSEVSEIPDKESTQDSTFVASQDEVMIIDKGKENSQKTIDEKHEIPPQNQIEKEPEKSVTKSPPIICRLSNSLNILSDDEDEPPPPATAEPPKEQTPEKQCIDLVDDDDIMLIDEDTNSKDSKTEKNESQKTGSNECDSNPIANELETDVETGEKTHLKRALEISTCTIEEATSSTSEHVVETDETPKVPEKTDETNKETKKPLLPDNFLKSSRKNIADMTREDLEEFCILKIVESIVDRSNLSEIKTKLKAMAQNLEDYKKKAMMLAKQNSDLEVVLKSVQDEQQRTNGVMVTPLKITRSVGMQVYMTDKAIRKKNASSVTQTPAPTNTKTRSATNSAQKANKIPNTATIPVPRLIPANNAAIRGPLPQNSSANSGKLTNTSQVNGVKNPAPVQKQAEKRPLGKSQSVTVDLTDDEPPAKMALRGPTPPVRLVPSQNLLAPQRAQFGQAINTPRKVYIPISGPQGQQIKPGQTIMVKTSPTGPNRQRGVAPTITRLTTNQIRLNRVGQGSRHPAALPDVVKQYQPSNWKALPPAPDLKLSKVENGIVISWKIEGYQEDTYEEIASYQLYAYQETSSPPSTALWKKIGDVKALPLPMACTLTQFMAGFKYYFAVRAVDVKSRVGPFSLPGSILLLNKM